MASGDNFTLNNMDFDPNVQDLFEANMLQPIRDLDFLVRSGNVGNIPDKFYELCLLARDPDDLAGIILEGKVPQEKITDRFIDVVQQEGYETTLLALVATGIVEIEDSQLINDSATETVGEQGGDQEKTQQIPIDKFYTAWSKVRREFIGLLKDREINLAEATIPAGIVNYIEFTKELPLPKNTVSYEEFLKGQNELLGTLGWSNPQPEEIESPASVKSLLLQKAVLTLLLALIAMGYLSGSAKAFYEDITNGAYVPPQPPSEPPVNGGDMGEELVVKPSSNGAEDVQEELSPEEAYQQNLQALSVELPPEVMEEAIKRTEDLNKPRSLNEVLAHIKETLGLHYSYLENYPEKVKEVKKVYNAMIENTQPDRVPVLLYGDDNGTFVLMPSANTKYTTYDPKLMSKRSPTDYLIYGSQGFGPMFQLQNENANEFISYMFTGIFEGIANYDGGKYVVIYDPIRNERYAMKLNFNSKKYPTKLDVVNMAPDGFLWAWQGDAFRLNNLMSLPPEIVSQLLSIGDVVRITGNPGTYEVDNASYITKYSVEYPNFPAGPKLEGLLSDLYMKVLMERLKK